MWPPPSLPSTGKVGARRRRVSRQFRTTAIRGPSAARRGTARTARISIGAGMGDTIPESRPRIHPRAGGCRAEARRRQPGCRPAGALGCRQPGRVRVRPAWVRWGAAGGSAITCGRRGRVGTPPARACRAAARRRAQPRSIRDVNGPRRLASRMQSRLVRHSGHARVGATQSSRPRAACAAHPLDDAPASAPPRVRAASPLSARHSPDATAQGNGCGRASRSRRSNGRRRPRRSR